MKKFILASASGLALLGLAACSDSTDQTKTQSINPPPAEQAAPAPQAAPPASPAPETGGDVQTTPAQPAPPPAP